jgi:hypothetical protein
LAPRIFFAGRTIAASKIVFLFSAVIVPTSTMLQVPLWQQKAGVKPPDFGVVWVGLFLVAVLHETFLVLSLMKHSLVLLFCFNCCVVTCT